MKRIEKFSLSFITGEWPPDEDKKTIVFLHGAAATGAIWMQQLIDLSEKFNIIVPDLPGHGKSTASGFDNIAKYTEIVCFFLNELERNCIIAGISMGGAIAQELMGDHCKYIDAGILINTGAKMKVLPSLLDAIRYDFKTFLIGMTDIMFPAKSSLKYIEPSLKLIDIMENRQKIVLDDFIACDNFDFRERLKDISCPVLIISSENDILMPFRYGEYLNKNIKSSEFILIKDAGHLSTIEKFEEVDAAIFKFVSAL
jgi:pimeloyl-ACP methyl ester carboxylesterase